MIASVGTLPPVTGYRLWGYVLDGKRVAGFGALPLPFASLLLMLGTLANVTVPRGWFEYTGLRTKCNSQSKVSQLFGQATTRLCRHFAEEHDIPLESGLVH